MKLKSLFVAAALLVCGSVFAQEKGPFQTNKFLDNWFISVGGGIDYVIDGNVGGGMSGAFDLSLGKWFDPNFGIRAGYEGFSYAVKNVTPTKAAFNELHADFLWNSTNHICGYKEDRVYNLIPYVHFDGILGDSTTGMDIGAGLGLLNNFRLSSCLSIFADLRANGFHGDMIYASGLALSLSASVGLTYNFKRNNWDTVASAVAPALAAAAAAEAAQQALQAEKDKLAAQKAAADKKNAQLAKENEGLKDELAKSIEDNKALIKGLLDTPMVAYFEIGQAKLSKKELAHVDYIVNNIMSLGKNAKFTLSGNADSKTGSKKRNKQLSEQRANYLYKLLTEKYGMSADKFTVKANGGNDVFDTPELNRAVIIEVE